MSDDLDRVVTAPVLKSELTVLRSELKSELTVLRSELTVLRTELRSELKSELTVLRSEMTDLEKRLEKRIAEDGATTRTHFDIMVEKVNDSVRLVAEVAARYGITLDNDESRLQKFERR